MRPRRAVFGFSISVTVLAAFTLPGIAAAPYAATAAGPRPTILILETDDQTAADMSVLPGVRRLIGREGVTFDRSFVSFSLCCPSRATLLTGQYAHNNRVRGNAPPNGGYRKLDSRRTLAVWLRRSGYHTVLLGKYLNGYGVGNPKEVPPGWSEWHGSVDPSTYRYYDYRLNENGRVRTYCRRRAPSCYQTDVVRRKAAAIIRRLAPRPQPFFLWVAFVAPHAGYPVERDDPPTLGTPARPPRYRRKLENASMPVTAAFNEADVSDKPGPIQELPLIGSRGFDAIQENWRQRHESLLAVDDAVRSIVATLRATGELSNTLILFTSDNGFMQGEHRIPFGKIVAYEPSIRVPLLLRGPGIPKGVHRSQLVANLDYAPTILAAAGVKPGRVEDGISLLPLARDGGKEPGRDLLLESGPGPDHFEGIRTRNWVYIEYRSGDRELYDLRHDPSELQSLDLDPRYADLRQELSRRMHRLAGCAGSICRTAPRVSLTLLARSNGSCRTAPVVASVSGSDVSRVEFQVNRRTVGKALYPPFRASLPRRSFRPGRNVVRARVILLYDRLVTKDAAISCG